MLSEGMIKSIAVIVWRTRRWMESLGWVEWGAIDGVSWFEGEDVQLEVWGVVISKQAKGSGNVSFPYF